LAVLKLFRPYRTPLHVGLSLGRSIYALILTCLLLSAGIWVEIVVPNVAPARVAEVEKWLNLPLLVTLAAIGIASAVGIVRDVRRLAPPFQKKLSGTSAGAAP
jgi:hypothetical protein